MPFNPRTESGFLRLTGRILLIVLTIAVAAAAGYFTMMLASSSEVDIGPLKVGFRLTPALHGSSEVDIPPAGSLTADTHSGPAKVLLDLKEISVQNLDELTNPDSPSRQALVNWKDPVQGEERSMILRVIVLSAAAGALSAGVIQRRWRWALGGAAIATAVVVSVGAVTYMTYDTSAFNQPHYEGALAYAPDVLAFSQKTLANLDDYENRVPEIAASLYSTVNELHQLPSVAPDSDTIRIVHVSDMHSSQAAANLVREVAGLYNADMVIDTGDETELGTPFEVGYPSTYLPLPVPYIWNAGNHDTPAVINKMKSISGVTVLDAEETTVDGVTVAGFADPQSQSLLPDVDTDAQVQSEQARIADFLSRQTQRPFVVDVHDPRTADKLAGKVPVVLNGHTHRQSIDVRNGTVFLDAGSTGAGGMRSVNHDGSVTPSTLQVLYIRKDSLKLQAADSITIDGVSQEFSVARRVFGAGEGDATRTEASATPVG